MDPIEDSRFDDFFGEIVVSAPSTIPVHGCRHHRPEAGPKENTKQGEAAAQSTQIYPSPIRHRMADQRQTTR